MPEMIYYDGHCGLCHHWVTYVLKHDPAGEHFEFSPLGSAHFREHVPGVVRETLPDSVVVLRDNGGVLVKSDAAVHILKQLGGRRATWGKLLGVIPRPLRDLGYAGIASLRHLLFKTPEDACPMMPPELRARFHF